MNENSTQLKNEIGNDMSVTPGPKESTVNFLKQFARVYICNNSMKEGLGEFFAN